MEAGERRVPMFCRHCRCHTPLRGFCLVSSCPPSSVGRSFGLKTVHTQVLWFIIIFPMKRQFYGCPSVWDKPMGHACDVWGDDLTAANSQVANFILGLFENGFFEVSELICCMELRALRAWGRMKWLGLFVLWKKPWGIMGSPQELSKID